MQNIKETIEYFCRILEAFNIQNIQPNDFRQAKHDQAEAVEPMLKLLKSLLVLDLFNFDTKQCNKDIDDEQLLLFLVIRGCAQVYENDSHYFMDYGSSRDLLLISGQILAEQNIFEKYHVLFLRSVDESNFKKEAKQTGKPQQYQPASIPDNKHDFCQNFAQLSKQLAQKQKEVHQQEQRKQKLKTKIQCMLNQSKNKCVNIEDLLNDTGFEIGQLIDTLTLINQEKESVRHQDIFWQWMESVVEEDKKQYRQHPNYGFDSNNLFNQVQTKGILKRIYAEFQNALFGFSQLQTQFEKEWERVSTLLQSRSECCERLQHLSVQIPKIIQRHKRDYLQLYEFQENILDTDGPQFPSNQIIKDQMTKLIQDQLKNSFRIHVLEKEFTLEQMTQEIKQESLVLEQQLQTIQKVLNNDFIFFPTHQ